MKQYLQRNQMLSSLVFNPPYSLDGITIPKVKVKTSFYSIIRRSFYLIFFLSILMTITSLVILYFYLPLQSLNNNLFQSAKAMNNKKLSLLASLQQTASYNKLFVASDKMSLGDPEEVIYIKYSNKQIACTKQQIAFINYPSLQFAGF